ncbi:TolC family outer membrane protein [Thalassovita sp.]|uniref:TolC family outer membrane protein n=1 Tax=Thalassovita sp. TaxID=1979401 RepID=UPI002B27B282|nr:TolC family outer membrane protein [Thalassovita sp.]
MGGTGIRRKVMTGIAAVMLTVTGSGAVQADNLADVLADAYKNSGLLEQNRALLRAADEDVAVALSALRPIVSWAGDVTRSTSRFASTSTFLTTRQSSSTTVSLGLSAQLLLFDGGASKGQIEAAKETVLATRQALVGVEQNVLLQAVDAYTNLRTQAETVTLRQNNVRVISEELRAAKDRFDVGEVTRTDVAQAEARLAQARAALAQAQGDYQGAREYFIAAVGRKPGTMQPSPAAPATASSIEGAKALALKNHPDILQAQHQVAAADLAVEVARLNMGPTVSLTGNYGIQEDFNTTAFSKGGSVGVEVSGPIYAGGRLSAAYRRAAAQRDSARAALRLSSISVAQNAATAFANLQVARAARVSSDRQVRFATVAFRGVREEATLGARTTLDVLNAEQELLNARANLITSRSNEYLASYSLLANLGLLTADHLKLNVTRYDPAAYYNQVKNAPAHLSAQGQKLDRVLRGIGKE